MEIVQSTEPCFQFQSRYSDRLGFKLKGEYVPSDREELIRWYWGFHPRFRFFKTVPFRARLLDVGSASGGLYFWKCYLPPVREDIELYGVDQFRGEYIDHYEGFEIANLDKAGIPYPDHSFDTALVSHVLEHLAEPGQFLQELRRTCRPGARVYFELPRPETLSYPKRADLEQEGIVVPTVNFFDDLTHRKTYSPAEFAEICEAQRFQILEQGRIRIPHMEDPLFAYGFEHKDSQLVTFAVWSRLEWAQWFLVALEE